MSENRKFRVWLDSGANIHSKREVIVTLEEIGYTGEDWDGLSDQTKEEILKEIAWEDADWGFAEV